LGYHPFTLKPLPTHLKKIPEVDLIAAAHLGQDNETLKAVANITKESYAEKYQVKLYETAEEMIDKESLDMVFICSKILQDHTML